MEEKYPPCPHETRVLQGARIEAEDGVRSMQTGEARIMVDQLCTDCGATRHPSVPFAIFVQAYVRTYGITNLARQWVGKPPKPPVDVVELVTEWDGTEAMYEFLNNREYELEPGLWGRFQRAPDRKEPHGQVWFEPYRWLPAYMEQKRKLGDDWDTNMTHSERLVEIASELGMVWNPIRD